MEGIGETIEWNISLITEIRNTVWTISEIWMEYYYEDCLTLLYKI